jgi:hypothetical protein
MIMEKTVQYAKEIDDVMMLVVELLKDVKAGKGALEIGAENLPLLMQAVAGAEQIKDELAMNKEVVLQTIGSQVGSIAAVFV